ncbi:MAG: substrate-binding domain-containing protein [Thermoplasmata archaeon]
MKRYLAVILIIAVIVILIGSYLYVQKPSQSLEVYAADAYVAEANHLISGFKNATGLPINDAKGGGSFTLASEIGQGDPSDIFISVALNSYEKQYLGSRYSGWAVAFAADSLVIAYNNATLTGASKSVISGFESATSNSISGYSEAFANLTSGSFKVGISDPNKDPAGLRAMISLEIAGYLYHGGNISYYIERMQTDGAISSASSAAELVAPLEQGSISFLYIYKSSAISQGLGYIELPQDLNFGNASLAPFYSKFSYATASGNQTGSPVFLYVSVLANDSLRSEAMKFVCYVINNSAQMAAFGMEVLKTGFVYANATIPVCLQSLVSDGKLSMAGIL